MNPTRSWRKKTGPGETTLLNAPITRKSGNKVGNAKSNHARSNSRFAGGTFAEGTFGELENPSAKEGIRLALAISGDMNIQRVAANCCKAPHLVEFSTLFKIPAGTGVI